MEIQKTSFQRNGIHKKGKSEQTNEMQPAPLDSSQEIERVLFLAHRHPRSHEGVLTSRSNEKRNNSMATRTNKNLTSGTIGHSGCDTSHAGSSTTRFVRCRPCDLGYVKSPKHPWVRQNSKRRRWTKIGGSLGFSYEKLLQQLLH